MGDFDFLADELETLEAAGLLRKLLCAEPELGPVVRIEGAEKVVFCSNDYLALAADPRIVAEVAKAMANYGHGAGASRLISGTTPLHVELEMRFARLFEKEAALVFPSGWTANEALLKTLPGKGDVVLMDKLDHASIIDAARAGGAEFRTYRRDRLGRLERFLGETQWRRKFIVTESIFSMDGDTADLAGLVELKKRYGAILIVDEAHALGCRGERGAGLAEEAGVLKDVDIVVATLSKALGSAGGIVASDKLVIDFLVNKARSFIYTTAPTISNCAAALAALDIVSAEPQRRQSLRKNSQYLRDKLIALDADTGSSDSHIIPVIIGEPTETVRVSRKLFEEGYLAPAIRPPTVAPGTSRLRLSVQSEHTFNQIDGLCRALAKLIQDNGAG